MSADSPTIWTIGHSTLETDDLCVRLRDAGVRVLIDVRSSPYSRFVPRFNRETLAAAVQTDELAYEYFGDILGGRTTDPALLGADGKPDYDKMAERPAFRAAITELLKRAREESLCLMCAEEDPAYCHRTRLVANALVDAGGQVVHLRHNGERETQAAVTLRRTGGQLDLF